MKSANLPFGGAPAKPHSRAEGPGQSQTRMRSGADARPPREPGDPRRVAEPRVERGVWSRITSPPSTSSTPPEPKRALAPRSATPRTNEEPRTGVVRRLPVSAPPGPPQSGALERSRQRARQREAQRVSLQPGQSGILQRDRRDDHASEASAAGEDVRAWRCLEWGSTPKARVQKKPKVTIAQLSAGGEPVRQNGPDAWLPEAGDFVHRMAQLVARSFGHERCRSVCLRGSSAVLAISEVNDSKVMAVTGPASSMANVLRRAGLE